MLTVYPSDRAVAGVILAHGAGAGQRSRFMVLAGQEMSSRRIATATFDFPYIAEGRKIPDKAPVLEARWRAAIDAAQQHSSFASLPLFIGGKSMGGRIASQVAAQHLDGLAGLVFLGYPLHPPGRPGQRRDVHLPEITEPMLFVQGTRDQFGTAQEIRELLPRLAGRATLIEIPGGDHSFKAPGGAAACAAALTAVFGAVEKFIDAHVR
jgi:predicted alpha/beta-hydrolase family hydrolase